MTDATDLSDSYESAKFRIEEIQLNTDDKEKWVNIDWECNNSDSAIDASNHGSAAIENCNYNSNSAANLDANSSEVTEMTVCNYAMKCKHTQLDESDDVSIITESEAESDVSNINKICHYRRETSQVLSVLNGEQDWLAQAGRAVNTVLVCSLGVLLGLAICRMFFTTDTCSVSNRIDFETLKTESDNLLSRIKELHEVRNVFDEIQAKMPQVRRTLRQQRKALKKNVKKPAAVLDSDPFAATSTVFEELQIAVNSLVNTVDRINHTNKFSKTMANISDNILGNLTVFQGILNDLYKSLQNTNGTEETRFLLHVNKKIYRLSQSILSDLSETLYDLMLNIFYQYDLVRYKLSRRLCHIRNTLPEGQNFLKALEENNSFLSSCDQIFSTKWNVSEKLHDRRNAKHPSKKHKSSKTKNVCTVDSNTKCDKKNSSKRNRNERAVIKGSEDKSVNKKAMFTRRPLMADLKERQNVFHRSSLSQDTCLSQQLPFDTKGNNETSVNVFTLNLKDSYVNDNARNDNSAEKFRNIINFDSKQKENVDQEKTIQRDNLRSITNEESNVGSAYTVKRKKSTERAIKGDFHRKEKISGNHSDRKSKTRKSKEKNSREMSLGAEWLFERSHAREKMRYPLYEDESFSAPNWYFGRADSRRSARENLETKSCVSNWYFRRARSRRNAREDSETESYNFDCRGT